EISNSDQVLGDFDKELIRVTRHPVVVQFTEVPFEKAELRFEDGGRKSAFIIVRDSKQLLAGTNAHRALCAGGGYEYYI
ncbi:hypothetical protein BGX21_008255, partial [Mortierella sp. AD011]